MKKERLGEHKPMIDPKSCYKQWPLILGAILTLILSACGGGGGDGDNNSPADTGGSGSLRITVLDDPLTGQPLSGAYVSLYNADNQTISQTLETDADGVADFGDVSASLTKNLTSQTGTVTLTIAYEDNGQGAREIRTIYDTLPGSYSIYMKDVGCASQDTINVTYNNMSGGAVVATLDPHLSGDGALLIAHSTLVNSGSAQFSNVPVCLDDIQSDGKLTHFAMALDNTGEMSNYGFETDQTISNGASYTGNADLVPTSINWSAASGTDHPDVIVLRAVRKDVAYSNLGFWPLPGSSGAQASGSFPVADQFPADAFIVAATQSEGVDNNKLNVRRYETYQSSVAVDFTDNEFTSFSYDSTTENFSWTLTGNNSKDFLQIDTEFSAPTTVKWNLTLPPQATDVTLPALPTAVQAWFDRANITLGETEVMAGDVLSSTGYDDFLALTAATANLVSQSVTMDSDMVFRKLGGSTNGGGNGGGDALYGTLTFEGTGVASFPSATYEPTTAVPISPLIAWTDGDVVVQVQSLAPLDDTKAANVTISLTDGISSSWVAVLLGMDGVAGVSISANSIIFANVVVTNQSLGTSMTVNGTLSY